jgi:hypothetical protein
MQVRVQRSVKLLQECRSQRGVPNPAPIPRKSHFGIKPLSNGLPYRPFNPSATIRSNLQKFQKNRGFPATASSTLS